MCRAQREVLFRQVEITTILAATVGLVHRRWSLLRHFLSCRLSRSHARRQFFVGQYNYCPRSGNDAGVFQVRLQRRRQSYEVQKSRVAQ